VDDDSINESTREEDEKEKYNDDDGHVRVLQVM
jgi:hypothetical protein